MGAEFGNEDLFSQRASDLGKYIAVNGYQMIYGGGRTGLMGVVARSVMENGVKF